MPAAAKTASTASASRRPGARLAGATDRRRRGRRKRAGSGRGSSSFADTPPPRQATGRPHSTRRRRARADSPSRSMRSWCWVASDATDSKPPTRLRIRSLDRGTSGTAPTPRCSAVPSSPRSGWTLPNLPRPCTRPARYTRVTLRRRHPQVAWPPRPPDRRQPASSRVNTGHFRSTKSAMALSNSSISSPSRVRSRSGACARRRGPEQPFRAARLTIAAASRSNTSVTAGLNCVPRRERTTSTARSSHRPKVHLDDVGEVNEVDLERNVFSASTVRHPVAVPAFEEYPSAAPTCAVQAHPIVKEPQRNCSANG